jgi:hypothetical protein
MVERYASLYLILTLDARTRGTAKPLADATQGEE